MTPSGVRGYVLAVVGALALTACASTSPPDIPATTPTARPITAPAPTPRAQPSQASRALTDYYSRIQQNYLAQGLLRVDGGGPDTPILEHQLVENFIRIALFEEFSSVGGRMVRSQSETRLHRWKTPIRLKVHFGDSVSDKNRSRDMGEISRFAARLSRIISLPISVVDQNANFHVFIVNEDERQVIGPQLRAISPEINTLAVNTVQGMRRSTLCLVFSIDGNEDSVYSRSVAVIRAEHPDLLRLSCIHEELAQGLGLPNDSPQARPSVFNDDEEFGLLTTHDEYLLQMLYDPRMRPGMTVTEARPVAKVIASEILRGQGSS